MKINMNEKSQEALKEKDNNQEIPSRRKGTKRKRQIRGKTIAVKRLTKESLRLGRILYPETEYTKPLTRGECKEIERPCPYTSCQYHLYLDVNPNTGSIKINFPDLEPWEIPETCALDVAEKGGITLEEVGEILNLTRERIRQVEVRGLAKVFEGARKLHVNG